MKKLILILLIINTIGCNSDSNSSSIIEKDEPLIVTPTEPIQQPIEEMYFTPKNGNTMKTTSAESLE